MNKCRILCYALSLQLVLVWALAAQPPTPAPVAVLKPKIALAWEYPKDEEKFIQGFRIYYGKVSRADAVKPEDVESAKPYDQHIDVGPKERAVILDLSPGSYYANVAVLGVVDEKRSVSGFTKEISAYRGLLEVGNLKGTIQFFEVPID